jgi:Cu/Ag efflux pump CusA
VDAAVKLPIGYKFDWGGEYKEYLASQEQMKIILPLTVVLILLILFALYGNLKFPLIIFFSVLVTEPVGGLLALRLTHTNFSVSSMLGFVALMGVAVQTSVILYSFINKLRLEGMDIMTATHEASLLRLRPIMMTALVACFGLLPAAMSTGIGSDSQKPFAIVIVGGLASRLLLSIFLARCCTRWPRATATPCRFAGDAPCSSPAQRLRPDPAGQGNCCWQAQENLDYYNKELAIFRSRFRPAASRAWTWTACCCSACNTRAITRAR